MQVCLGSFGGGSRHEGAIGDTEKIHNQKKSSEQQSGGYFPTFSKPEQPGVACRKRENTQKLSNSKHATANIFGLKKVVPQRKN